MEVDTFFPTSNQVAGWSGNLKITPPGVPVLMQYDTVNVTGKHAVYPCKHFLLVPTLQRWNGRMWHMVYSQIHITLNFPWEQYSVEPPAVTTLERCYQERHHPSILVNATQCRFQFQNRLICAERIHSFDSLRRSRYTCFKISGSG